MLNLAVIGTGYWGINLVRTFGALPNCRLRWLCDLDKARLEEVAGQFSAERSTTQIEDVLADSAVDGVIVALPASMHFEAASQSLRAGKHTFVEKPLAMSVAEAAELVDLARQVNRVLMVGHTFEFNAAVVETKRLIDSGELGQIHYIYSQRLNLGRVRSDVNAMWNLAPHDVSILMYWLGAIPESVSAYGHSHLQDRIEDVVFMHLAFPQGIHAHIHVSWLDPGKVRKATVVGSRKMVIYDDTSADRKLEIYDKGIDRKKLDNHLGSYQSFGEFQFIHRAGDIVIPKLGFPEPLQVECRHFLECIRDNKQPRTDGMNGLRVVAVLEAAQRSLVEQGRPVAVRLDVAGQASGERTP
jgi:predicted dehydrogenase